VAAAGEYLEVAVEVAAVIAFVCSWQWDTMSKEN
jgi:hypothetical protein